jgi:hypothetical protein
MISNNTPGFPFRTLILIPTNDVLVAMTVLGTEGSFCVVRKLDEDVSRKRYAVPYRVLVGHEYGGSTVEKRY